MEIRLNTSRNKRIERETIMKTFQIDVVEEN